MLLGLFRTGLLSLFGNFDILFDVLDKLSERQIDDAEEKHDCGENVDICFLKGERFDYKTGHYAAGQIYYKGIKTIVGPDQPNLSLILDGGEHRDQTGID